MKSIWMLSLSIIVSLLISIQNVSALMVGTTYYPYVSNVFNLTISAGTTPIGYQGKIQFNGTSIPGTFDWANECINSNNTRMAIVNGTQNGSLSLWVEQCSSAGKNMTVWIKSDVAISTTPIPVYIAYGNTTATLVSNIESTMLFGDDFDDASLNWTKWISSDHSNYAESGSVMTMTVASAATEVIQTAGTYSNFTWETKIKTASQFGYGALFHTVPATYTGNTLENVLGWGASQIQIKVNGTYSLKSWGTDGNNFYRMVVKWPTAGVANVYTYYYDNMTLAYSDTTDTPTTSTNLYLSMLQWGGATSQVDFAFARQNYNNLDIIVSMPSNYTIDNYPVVAQNIPADNLYRRNATSVSVSFNCSVTDDINIANISLLMNSTGTWHINQTTSLTGTINQTTWTLSVPATTTRDISWACRAGDNSSQYMNTANRTIHIIAPAANGTWVIGASMPLGQADTCSVTIGSKIYTMGGYGANGTNYLNAVYEYDASTNVYTQKAGMITARWGHSCTQCENDVCVFGGTGLLGSYMTSAERYNASNNTWYNISSLPAAFRGASTLVYNGNVYLVGGENGTGYEKNSLLLYYPGNDTYVTTLANMTYPRRWGTIGQSGTTFYYFGGDAATTYKRAENYSVTTNTWQTMTNLTFPSFGTSITDATINGKIYSTHGLSGSFYNWTWEFNTTNASWTQRSSATHLRDGMGSSVYDSSLYVFGGRNSTGSPYGIVYMEIFYPYYEAPAGGSGNSSVTNCMNISSSGTYVLINNVTSPGTCFNITTSDVILDCNGYWINYSQTVTGFAVNISSVNNITLKNCNIVEGQGSTNARGIRLYDADNCTIFNNNVKTYKSSSYALDVWHYSNNNNFSYNTANASVALAVHLYDESINNTFSNNVLISGTSDGISVDSTYNNTISNNTISAGDRGIAIITGSNNQTISGNNITSIDYAIAVFGTINGITIRNNRLVSSSTYGLSLIAGAGGTPYNVIYNNLINGSSVPVELDDPPDANRWNTTNSTGTNIIGGHYIGGNYYTNFSGTGYSDICTDSDANGYCDSSYNVTTNKACSGAACGNNVDYLAYSNELEVTTEISTCSNLNTVGMTYLLTADISNSAFNICMNITANNVTLDCQGHMIDGISSDYSEGVTISRGDPIIVANVTIRNCNITDWNFGIRIFQCKVISLVNNTISNTTGSCAYFTNSDNNIIKNNTLSKCGGYGIDYPTSSNSLISGNSITQSNDSIEFMSCGNNTFINNTIADNFAQGITMYNTINITIANSIIRNSTIGIHYFGGTYSDNHIYNNLFNNTQNVKFESSASGGFNYFNTTNQSGTRIYSNGTQIGGNYWTNSSGTGYSDTCTDANTDGFCDSYLNVSTMTSCAGASCGNNTDYLPLSNEYSTSGDTTPPNISWNTPATNNTFTQNTSWIYWNTTISESPGQCYLNLNGTSNTTMNKDGNFCWYNSTSLTNATTYCGRVYANDTSGNLNLSSSMCVTINLTYSETNGTIYCSTCQCINDTMTNYVNDAVVIYLTSDINNWVGDCVVFGVATNKTLDCQGNSINGDNSGTDIGITIGTESINNTVQNCKLTNFTKGISVTGYNGTIIGVNSSYQTYGLYFSGTNQHYLVKNSNFIGNQYGIYIFTSTYNTFNNISIVTRTDSYSAIYGIYAQSGSAYDKFSQINITGYGYGYTGRMLLDLMNDSIINTTIPIYCGEGISYCLGYSNISNNQFIGTNINLNYGLYNKYNTTKILATNIIGGAYTGGNYWSKNQIYWNTTSVSPNGFSDTCTDADGDSICDSVYQVDQNSYDYLPLKNLNFPPSPKFISPTLSNNSFTNNVTWIYVNVSADKPLNSCTMNWNGANQTMALGGNYCYNNMTSLVNGTAYYFRVFANDSIGNMNVTEWRQITVRLIDYSINYTQTQIADVIEQTSHTFTLNATASDTTTFSASLVYNGNIYSATKTVIDSNTSYFTASATSPIVTSTYEDKDWYWNLTANAINMDTTTQQQRVYKMILTNCSSDSESTTKALWYYLKDEESSNPITGTFGVTYNISAGETFERAYPFNFTGQNNYSVCIYPDWASYYADAIGAYNASGYLQRSYYLTNHLIDNSTETTNLLLSTASSTLVTITVVDTVANPQEGIDILVQRYYPGTGIYEQVYSLRTGADGKTIAYMIPYDVWYKFILSKDGIVLRTVSPMVITSSTLTLTVDYPSYGEVYDYVGGVASHCTWNGNTSVLSCTVIDSTGAMTNACLNVTKYGAVGLETEYEICSDEDSSTLIWTGGNASQFMYPYSVYAYFPSTKSLVNNGVIGSKHDLYDTTGNYAIMVALIILFVVSFLSITANPVIPIIMSCVAMIAGFALGVLPIGLSGLASIIVAGAIIILKMRT